MFARAGYRGASVDEIASLAGYSTGAIYSNFAGKDGLFLALLEERIDQRLAQALADDQPNDRPLDAHQAAQHFTAILRDERESVLLLVDFWAQAVRDPQAAERFAERHAALRALFARLLDAAERRAGGRFTLPVDHLATALIAFTNGLAIERLADPQAVPDELYGQVVTGLLRAFHSTAS